MAVTLVDNMGSDLSVVNAARVSFDKQSEHVVEERGEILHFTINEADKKLIKYLAKHNHWSPFSHAFASFRIKAPIFVARQLGKHQVGLSWNEVSRRYVDSEPEFFMPDEWRKRASNVKQGSSDEVIKGSVRYPKWHLSPSTIPLLATKMYTHMLELGVCPEQARMFLPQNTMTEWIWSGSLYAFARICKLRLDPHTQKECRDVVVMIDQEMQKLFPVSWEALKA